jgi:hypothetical protein
MKQERTQLVWLSAHPKHTLIRVREGLRAGELVGEERVPILLRIIEAFIPTINASFTHFFR